MNVLEEPEIRQGIKEYANWPTIPQLYVNGEFVGGSDIMREMYQSGELQKLLAEAGGVRQRSSRLGTIGGACGRRRRLRSAPAPYRPRTRHVVVPCA